MWTCMTLRSRSVLVSGRVSHVSVGNETVSSSHKTAHDLERERTLCANWLLKTCQGKCLRVGCGVCFFGLRSQ